MILKIRRNSSGVLADKTYSSCFLKMDKISERRYRIFLRSPLGGALSVIGIMRIIYRQDAWLLVQISENLDVAYFLFFNDNS